MERTPKFLACKSKNADSNPFRRKVHGSLALFCLVATLGQGIEACFLEQKCAFNRDKRVGAKQDGLIVSEA